VKYEIIDGSAGPTLVLRDQLTFADRDLFDSVIDRLLARRSPAVAVDLGGLDYMDSAGLGMLLTLRDRADVAAAQVRLLRPKGEVKELLALACFDTLFTIGDT
jgi:anti-sigma B factor antagonist